MNFLRYSHKLLRLCYDECVCAHYSPSTHFSIFISFFGTHFPSFEIFIYFWLLMRKTISIKNISNYIVLAFWASLLFGTSNTTEYRVPGHTGNSEAFEICCYCCVKPICIVNGFLLNYLSIFFVALYIDHSLSVFFVKS